MLWGLCPLVSSMSEVGTGSWKTCSLRLQGASGQASLPWGKKTLAYYLTNCSPSSALLSVREWLAWVQTHLISFTSFVGNKSHFSFVTPCPALTSPLPDPGPFAFAPLASAAEWALCHFQGVGAPQR